jgi:protein-L-isoaspartate(D-aspartate) O-methyltransferase
VIGILPERNLNNGPPSIHAALIAAATAPQLGEQVVHLGAGVGYYTAILAELIGATGGRVTTIEFHAELAARATVSFAQTPHIRAAHGDGTRVMFEPADVEPPPYSRWRRPGATRARGLPRRGRAADDPG